MAWTMDERHPLRRMFQGLIEQVFMVDLGVCDMRLLAYLGDLLSEFVHVDRIYRCRTVDGRTIRELSRIEAETCLEPDVDETERTRLINRYIGDFTLFWAGVYPEALRPRVATVDRMREYLLQGKRSYGVASELSETNTVPPADLLRRLSVEFELCVHGLQRVREGWQQVASARRN